MIARFFSRIAVGVLVVFTFWGCFSQSAFAMNGFYLSGRRIEDYLLCESCLVGMVNNLISSDGMILDLFNNYIGCFEFMKFADGKLIELPKGGRIIILSDENHIDNVVFNMTWDLFKIRVKNIITDPNESIRDLENIYSLLNMLKDNIFERYNKYLKIYNIRFSKGVTELELLQIYNSVCEKYSKLIDGFEMFLKMKIHDGTLLLKR